jgi:hypothetical protein
MLGNDMVLIRGHKGRHEYPGLSRTLMIVPAKSRFWTGAGLRTVAPYHSLDRFEAFSDREWFDDIINASRLQGLLPVPVHRRAVKATTGILLYSRKHNISKSFRSKDHQDLFDEIDITQDAFAPLIRSPLPRDGPHSRPPAQTSNQPSTDQFRFPALVDCFPDLYRF